MDAHKVLVGKEKWLFLHNDSNDVLAQHTGEKTLSDDEISRWKTLVHKRTSFVLQFSPKYFFLVCPDNHGIYSEYLPDNVALSKTRPIHALLDELPSEKGFELIYPLEELRDAKASGLVCATGDSHVTFYGAFVIYKALMNRIRESYADLKELDIAEVEFAEGDAVGDLSIKFDPPVAGRTVYSKVLEPKATLVSENGVQNRGQISIYENEDKSLPTAVLFRDSYGKYFADYLAESFSTLTVIATPLLEKDLILKLNPDFIISELAERFLINVPDDDFGESVEELIKRKASQD